MIGSVNGGIEALALLQARKAKSSALTGMAKEAKDASDAKDATASKAAEERRRLADDALQALKQANSDMKSQRKAAAAQKIARLKKELESLKMMSGGDPKVIARQAARIARELSAAAKEYSGASGGITLGASSTTAPTAEVAPTEAAATPADEAAVPAAAVSAAVPDGEAATGGNAEKTEVTAAQVQAAAEAKDGSAGDSHAGDEEKNGTTAERDKAEAGQDGKTLSPAEERAALVDKVNAVFSERAQSEGETSADKDFATEVRNLFSQAKALVEQQRRRAAEEGRKDQEFDQLSKDVTNAGSAIEQSFVGGAPELALLMPQVAVNIVV